MSIQLTLDHLDIKDSAKLSDFAMSSFVPIINTAQELLAGSVQELYIFGEHGSGKSHFLSAILQEYTDLYAPFGKMAMFLSVEELLETDPQALMGLEQFPLLLIDDIHLIANHRDWQESLFHLINRMRSQQHQMIFTATAPVRELDFGLLDLTTRLSQAISLPMPAGDSVPQRLKMIELLLKKRNLKLPDEVSYHLAEVGPHHIGDIATVLEHIAPQLSTQRNRKLPKKLLDGIKETIVYESFMTELADIDFDKDADEPDQYHNNLTLPNLY